MKVFELLSTHYKKKRRCTHCGFVGVHGLFFGMSHGEPDADDTCPSCGTQGASEEAGESSAGASSTGGGAAAGGAGGAGGGASG